MAAKAALLDDLSRVTRISIALDAQSTNNYLSFLVIKVYYINKKQQLQNKLIEFIPIRRRHTRASIATEVVRVLTSTNTKQQLLAITCNSASNNGTLTTTLKDRLEEKDIAQSSKKNAIPYLTYIINLVVQDVI